jgi:large subunit ribosomal protein L21
MFAVIKVTGKQYAISTGSHIDVDFMPGDEGSTISFSDVLLLDNNGKVTVGKPFVKNASVKAVIEKQYRGEKINVRRYKSKVRHRRSIGFRPQLTRLHITDIA